MSQEIKIDSPCAHPGGELGAWESMTIVGDTQYEHDASVDRAIRAGWGVWANGKIEVDGVDVPGAYLVRKIDA